jgi:organic hydroperoxide reductase OsmC/OhrA
MLQHADYSGALRWIGQHTAEPVGARSFTRDFVIEFEGKPAIAGSAPASYFGDDARHNPETLMVSSLLACHFLTYMSVCARAGVKVLEYSDQGTGTVGPKDGRMRMVRTVLRPRVRIADAASVEAALALHQKAHENCFMANSVNFPVDVEPEVTA